MATINTETQAVHYIDYQELLSLSNPNKTPIFSNLMAMGKRGTLTENDKVWEDYEVENTKTSLTADVTDIATSMTVADSSIFKANCFAVIDDELVKVTAMPTATTITVTRAQGGTTGAAHTTGAVLFLTSDGRAEGENFASEQFKDGVEYSNKTQIFRTPIEMTGSALTQAVVGTGGKSNWEMEEEKKKAKHEAMIEKAITHGVKTGGQTRTMGGLRTFLNNGQTVTCGAFTGNFYDKFTELCRKIDDRGGDFISGNYALIISPLLANKISSALKDYVLNNTTGLTTLGQVATALINDFGTVPLMISNNMRSSEAFLVNFDDVNLFFRVGEGEDRTMQYLDMGRVGDKKQAEWLSELTMTINKLHLQGKLVGITY